VYPSETAEYKDKILKKQPERIDTYKELIIRFLNTKNNITIVSLTKKTPLFKNK